MHCLTVVVRNIVVQQTDFAFSTSLCLDLMKDPDTCSVPISAMISQSPCLLCSAHTDMGPPWCREFADAVECVKGEHGRVVAVTSQDRAKAVNEKERPGFFDKIVNVL